MNKFLLTLAMLFAAMTVGVHAQKKVNRMVVHQKDGAEKTYVLENVDSVTFQKSTMKGGVTVSVMASTIAEEGTKKITKALGMATLPPGCRYGEMALIPDNGSVTDISAYIKSHCIQRMNATSNQWTVTGFDANTNYLVGVQAYTDDGDVISYGTAELSIGDGSVYDLGEGANTYIVPEKGKYSFMPMHVDGTLISGFTKVDWLWSTKAGLGNKQNLVSNIAIDESTGRVTFEATGKKGSVVLAAFDDAGKVVWTWLLWCTTDRRTCAMRTVYSSWTVVSALQVQIRKTVQLHGVSYGSGAVRLLSSADTQRMNGIKKMHSTRLVHGLL